MGRVLVNRMSETSVSLKEISENLKMLTEKLEELIRLIDEDLSIDSDCACE